ncbi:MAG: NAD-binding protein [Candidatus Hodarchaeales archaeon]|jgi:adenosylhomocysteinase
MTNNYDLQLLLIDELVTKQLDLMPIFKDLLQEYQKSLPFKDLRIIIAHVLVPNTIPLIASIMVGGGTILVTNSSLANDNATLNLLRSVGVEIRLNYNDATDYDYAVDVGAIFAKYPPKFGVVEVTRSGYHKYANNGTIPTVINADDSKVKLLETFLGNPESVLRGFAKFLGEPRSYLKGKTLAIIGFGKIGRGIARLFNEYCTILVCDIEASVLEKAQRLGFDTVLISEKQEENGKALKNSDILITCTGFPQIITKYFEKVSLQEKLLINLGAVDEYGSDYSSNDVFMSKDRPFNFNLDPPTENRYIDAILAGQAEGLRYLVSNKLSQEIHPLPREIDDGLLEKFVGHHNEDISDIYLYFDNISQGK